MVGHPCLCLTISLIAAAIAGALWTRTCMVAPAAKAYAGGRSGSSATVAEAVDFNDCAHDARALSLSLAIARALTRRWPGRYPHAEEAFQYV